jgi:Zn-finger nucleic acid-binding protein
MKACPNCRTLLAMADRQGVEIDYCPSFRGVWLDRGELDKIVERAARYARPDRDDDDSDWGDDRRKYGGPPPQPGYHPQGGYPPPGQHPPKKKEGFFSRLFDFD